MNFRILAGHASALLALLVLCACPGPGRPPTGPVAAGPALVAVAEPPVLTDDLDTPSLRVALDASIAYYRKAGSTGSHCFADQCFTGREMAAALCRFRYIVISAGTAEEKTRAIAEAFRFYRSTGGDGNGTVLFTGYFEPVLDGSLHKTDRFRWPLYRTPDETVSIHLGRFGAKYGHDRIVGRLQGKEVVPHFTRNQIDGGGSLEGKGLEIAWVDDPVALFFLHIQGSGRIRLPDGRFLRVGYAESNGRPFRGLTGYMAEKGLLAEREKTYEHLKAYLKEHPETQGELMAHNERYIFFRITGNGPVGSLGLTVVPGRSIAADPSVFPKGAPAFMVSRKPVFNDKGKLERWESFSRFVFSHDTGEAIKGPGRADLFCGAGDEAERVAGSLKEKGELFFLAPRR